MVAKYGENTTTHPTIDQDMWVSTTGEPQKGRLYGFADEEHVDVIFGSYATASTLTSHRGRREATHSPTESKYGRD